MGSPSGESKRQADEAQVEVTLSKGFWMGKFEVTQGQWKRVVGEFPGQLNVAAGEVRDNERRDDRFVSDVLQPF